VAAYDCLEILDEVAYLHVERIQLSGLLPYRYYRYVYHREPPIGYLLPDYMEQAHIKMTRKIDNEHLDISFIYPWYSFSL
jgi:hypothetical protein